MVTSPEALERGGWARRFTAFGQRLAEATALYQQLGYEVRLEPAQTDPVETPNSEVCLQCVVMTLAQTIYTRPRHGGDAAAEE